MSQLVRASVIGFLFGVSAQIVFHPGIFLAAFLAFLATLIFAVSRHNSKRFLVFFGILFFALGMFRAEFVPRAERSALRDSEGTRVKLTGIIVEDPDVRENSTRLIFETEGEKVLIVTKKYPEFEYGEKISVEGKLDVPQNFQTTDGRDFDYVSYLAKDAIFHEIAFPKVTILSKGNGNLIITSLLFVKRSFMWSVSQSIPEPGASLMGGLLLGTKRALSQNIQNDFRTAGIIHIVVLSGYNITVVADFMARMFSFLPFLGGMFASAFGIVLFALMTGAGASTVRASMMAILAIFARATGRESDALHLLFIAAFFMVMQNPLIVIYDPSFQLSFLATLGLFVLSPTLSKKISRVTPKWGIRETLATTLSTQIFVLPLLLCQTGIFSVVALPVNLVVLPVIPATMLFGFLTGVFGFISHPIGMLFGAPAFALLSYIFAVVHFFTRLPFASFTLSSFSIWIVAGIYFSYAIIFWRYKKSPTIKSETS